MRITDLTEYVGETIATIINGVAHKAMIVGVAFVSGDWLAILSSGHMVEIERCMVL